MPPGSSEVCVTAQSSEKLCQHWRVMAALHVSSECRLISLRTGQCALLKARELKIRLESSTPERASHPICPSGATQVINHPGCDYKEGGRKTKPFMSIVWMSSFKKGFFIILIQYLVVCENITWEGFAMHFFCRQFATLKNIKSQCQTSL